MKYEAARWIRNMDIICRDILILSHPHSKPLHLKAEPVAKSTFKYLLWKNKKEKSSEMDANGKSIELSICRASDATFRFVFTKRWLAYWCMRRQLSMSQKAGVCMSLDEKKEKRPLIQQLTSTWWFSPRVRVHISLSSGLSMTVIKVKKKKKKRKRVCCE